MNVPNEVFSHLKYDWTTWREEGAAANLMVSLKSILIKTYSYDVTSWVILHMLLAL